MRRIAESALENRQVQSVTRGAHISPFRCVLRAGSEGRRLGWLSFAATAGNPHHAP
jgi:hypothetical protein